MSVDNLLKTPGGLTGDKTTSQQLGNATESVVMETWAQIKEINMGLFYKVSPKKLFEVRNEIFVKNGIPALKKNGFNESPYRGMRFGKLDAGTYVFDLCRLNDGSDLETITTYISKRDSWIKVYLNVFKLTPALKSLEQLKELDGMQFFLPPNSITKMRLRVNGIKGIPLFNTVEHKIKYFYTESGFQERIEELGKLIEIDLSNIDFFIKRWHELHMPMVTDWEGNKID
jgi:hypothetical protein